MFVWFVWTPSEKDEWASQEMWRMQSTGGHLSCNMTASSSYSVKPKIWIRLTYWKMMLLWQAQVDLWLGLHQRQSFKPAEAEICPGSVIQANKSWNQDSKSWDHLAANRRTSSSRGRPSREELAVYFSLSLCKQPNKHAFWTSLYCLPLLWIRRNPLDLRKWSLDTCLALWPAWCQHSTLAVFKDHILLDRNTQANCGKTQDQMAKNPGRPCSGTAREATISSHAKTQAKHTQTSYA